MDSFGNINVACEQRALRLGNSIQCIEHCRKTVMDLKPGQWYWIRRNGGSVVPYRFHQLRQQPRPGLHEGEFFVGSMICTFPLSAVVGEAKSPRRADAGSSAADTPS